MHELAEQALAPVRDRSVAANAPLLERLGVTREQLEQLLTPFAWRDDPQAPRLFRAALQVTLRGATRF